MTDPRYARYYAHVWPLFWPWLWLQIFRLRCWQKLNKRDVLLSVDRMGNIHIRAVADAPSSRYRYDPPAVPAWQRPALGSDMPEEFLEMRLPAPDSDADAPSAPAPANSSAAPLYLQFDTS